MAVIRAFEAERGTPAAGHLASIRGALEVAGVEFTNGEGPGVRLKSNRPTRDQDTEGEVADMLRDAKGG